MPKARKVPEPDTALHVCWSSSGPVYVVKTPSVELLKRLDRMSGGQLRYARD